MPVVNFPSLLANVVMSSAVPSPSLTFFVSGLLKMAPCTSVFGIYAGWSSARAVSGDTRTQAAAARRTFRAIVNDIGMIELLKLVDNSQMIHRALMGGRGGLSSCAASMTTLQALFGIEIPVIQAPMAGAQDSALAAAVSNAGGLGSLPCATLGDAAIRNEISSLRPPTSQAC